MNKCGIRWTLKLLSRIWKYILPWMLKRGKGCAHEDYQMECKMALACFGLDYQNDGPKSFAFTTNIQWKLPRLSSFLGFRPKGRPSLAFGWLVSNFYSLIVLFICKEYRWQIIYNEVAYQRRKKKGKWEGERERKKESDKAWEHGRNRERKRETGPGGN